MAITFTLNGTSTLDETAGLQGLLSADADNDVAVGTLPAAFSTRLFGAAPGGLALSNTFPTNVGVAASGANLIHVAFDGSLSSLGLTDSAGAAFNGDASGITTADGQTVYLWGDAANKIVLGTTSSTNAPGTAGAGDVVFAVYMQETSGTQVTDVKLWTVTFEALQHPNAANPDDAVDIFQNVFINATGSTIFDFSALPSGQNLFGTVGNVNDAIIFFGKTPVLKADGTFSNTSDTINTSQGGGPTTIGVNNQMFDAGDGAYFTYVKTPNPSFLAGAPNGLDQGEADDADNMLYTGGLNPSTGANLKISQIQGNDLATLKLTAFKLDAAYQGRDLTTNRGGSGDDQINITAVRVFNAAGTLIEARTGANTPSPDATTVSITITGGVATVAGLDSGYRVEWDTAAPHSQVLVEGVAGKFDIGQFGISVGSSNHQSLATRVFVEDDGPTAPTLTPAGGVTHDETQGVDIGTDVAGSTDLGGGVTVASLFSGLAAPVGSDGDVTAKDGAAIGFARSTTPLVTLSGGGFGTDGQAGTNPVTYALNTAGGASGAQLTDGTAINLFVENGLIVGRAGATQAAPVAFALAINATTGEVYIAQYLSLKHSNTAQTDENTLSPSGVAGLTNDAVTVTVTYKDGDNDTATSTAANVGSRVRFEDDGPTAPTLASNANSVTHDETSGLDSTDVAGSTDTGGVTIASRFAGIAAPIGSDGDVTKDGAAIGFARSTNALVTPSGGSFGADGQAATGSVTYALSTAGGAAGAQTTDGTAINLFLENGLIVGRAGATQAAPVAFAVAINGATGEVYVAQYLSLKHSNTAQNDENTLSPSGLSQLTANSIKVAVTYTDGDGDQVASTAADVTSQVHFEDAGPTAPTLASNANSVTHDETSGLDSTDVAGSTDTGGVTIASRFAGIAAPIGSDGDVTKDGAAIGFARSTNALVTPSGGSFGADGQAATGSVTYALSTAGGAAGAQTTDGTAINLFLENGLIVGRAGATQAAPVAFAVAINGATGEVYVAQYLSLKHSDTGSTDENTLSPSGLNQLTANSIKVAVTYTDGDGDTAVSTAADVTSQVHFEDAGPSASVSLKAGVDLVVDETGLGPVFDSDTAANLFTLTSAYGADGAGTTVWSIAPSSADVDSGLDDVLTGSNILLHTVSSSLIEGRVGATAVVAFTVAIDTSNGSVTLTENRAIKHPDATNPDETLTMNAGLINATLTVTDGDGDSTTATDSISEAFKFKDDGPTIAGPASPGGAVGTPLVVSNAAAASNTGTFDYDLGADQYGTYVGFSDFVDAGGAAGVQLTLSGTVSGPPSGAITSPVVTLSSESATSAVFNFSFNYDKDPITAGVQSGTASGTLTFNKAADTYTVAVNTPVEGFSFNVLHTNELLAKNPTGNTGHPLIVVEKLAGDDTNTSVDEDFYVQFTADTTPLWFTATGDGPIGANDTVFTSANHDMAGGTETWVSATQSTNGVAGDTIQKDELLTLRFFKSDILNDATPPVNEQVAPTATAGGVILKFDGVGSSEDLILILDLKNTTTNATITRTVAVSNGDFFKIGDGVPAPYNLEFSITSQNDALVILEASDYNLAGENYEIQGVQIMQSANGLTGTAIDLNRAVGAGGGSTNAAGTVFNTLSFTDASFGNEQDVLKIVDIGFLQTTSGTQDAHLDFAFQIKDSDGDLTTTQHLFVDWITV